MKTSSFLLMAPLAVLLAFTSCRHMDNGYTYNNAPVPQPNYNVNVARPNYQARRQPVMGVPMPIRPSANAPQQRWYQEAFMKGVQTSQENWYHLQLPMPGYSPEQ